MPIKRKNSFVESVLNTDSSQWLEALESTLIGELANLGIPPWYVREMLENNEKPSEDWIKYCISQVELNEEALEPLTFPDYELCWLLLRVIGHAKETMKVENKAKSSEFWLSIGVSVGLHSHLIGRNKHREILERLRNSDVCAVSSSRTKQAV